jgi:uncharacterized protein YacL
MKTFLRRLKTHPSILISLLVIALALIEILPFPYSFVGSIVVAVLSVVALVLGIQEAQRDEQATEAQINFVYDRTPEGRHKRALEQLRAPMRKSGAVFPGDTPKV